MGSMREVRVAEVARGLVSRSVEHVSIFRVRSRSGTIVRGEEGDTDEEEG